MSVFPTTLPIPWLLHEYCSAFPCISALYSAFSREGVVPAWLPCLRRNPGILSASPVPTETCRNWQQTPGVPVARESFLCVPSASPGWHLSGWYLPNKWLPEYRCVAGFSSFVNDLGADARPKGITWTDTDFPSSETSETSGLSEQFSLRNMQPLDLLLSSKTPPAPSPKPWAAPPFWNVLTEQTCSGVSDWILVVVTHLCSASGRDGLQIDPVPPMRLLWHFWPAFYEFPSPDCGILFLRISGWKAPGHALGLTPNRSGNLPLSPEPIGQM